MIILLLAAAQLFAPPANPAPPVDCRFDSASLSFAGTPIEQARCLLRRVKPGGSADADAELPGTLARSPPGPPYPSSSRCSSATAP